MKLSEFGINENSQNLPQQICKILREVSDKGEHLLEWDVDGLVFDKQFIEQQLYISNTASEKELPKSMRKIAIKAEGLKDLTIDGCGNTIWFDNRSVQIAVINCSGLTFKNFNVDFVHPTVAEFTVVDKGCGYIDIAINQDTRYEIKGGRLHFMDDDKSRCVVQECDPQTGYTRRINVISYCSHNVLNNKFCKWVKKDEILRLYTSKPLFKVGATYQLAWVRRDGAAFFIDESRDITIANCNFKFMHGMGVLAQLTENITITDTDFLPNKDRGRTTATFADAMHFVNCKGDMIVKNVRVDGTRDDIINNHGVHMKIKKVEGDTIVVKFCHPQTYGLKIMHEGDELEFIDSKSLRPITTAVVKSWEMVNARNIAVTLCDIKDASAIKVGDVIENVTWTAALYVDNLEVFNDPTRGILVTTRRPVVIENSVFHKCYMPCVHISDDARSWYESGYCTDVLIKNNVFEDCYEHAVSIWPENIGSLPVHKNIRVIGNKITSKNGLILKARCAEGVVFKDNVIESAAPCDFCIKKLADSEIEQ